MALAEDYGRRFLIRREASQVRVEKRMGGEKAVREYVQALAKAYRSDDPALFEQAEVATTAQLTRVRALMSYNRLKKRQILSPELKNQRVEAVRVAGAEATVTTMETWSYAYLAPDTGQELDTGRKILKTNYRLIKKAGKWLVDDLVVSSRGSDGGPPLFTDPQADAWAAGEHVVGQYAQALAEAYRAGNPAVLEQADVATAAQVRQVRLFMAYNHFEKKQKLLAQLESQRIEDVQIAGEEASVTATESWVYAYIDEATAQEVSRASQTLKVLYHLKQASGKWLVDDLVASEVER